MSAAVQVWMPPLKLSPQAAKELDAVLADGMKLATFLRNGVKVRYGNRSEKLVEFGLQPFRRRRRENQDRAPDSEAGHQGVDVPGESSIYSNL